MQTKYFKFNLSCWCSKKETLTVWLSGKNTMNEIFEYLNGYLHFYGTNMSGMEENMIRKVNKVVYCNNDNKFILNLSNDDEIKAKSGDLAAKKAVRGFRKDGKYKNLRIYSLMGKKILKRSVQVTGLVTKVDTITNDINMTFKKNDVVPLFALDETNKQVFSNDTVGYFQSNNSDKLYLKLREWGSADVLSKVNSINQGKLTATLRNVFGNTDFLIGQGFSTRIDLSTTNRITAELMEITPLGNCIPPTVLKPDQDYSYFLTELPKINDNNTITLKFRDDQGFITTIPGVEGFAGIGVVVFYLPKGTKVEDLSFKKKNSDRCDYEGPFLPSGSPVTIVIGKALGPTSSRQGLLTINVDNTGYTGIGGNTRLYISVTLQYRNIIYAFYVN